MGDGYLQAILVLGLNGVSLLNKERLVHHDDKGTGVNDAAAESGKGKHAPESAWGLHGPTFQKGKLGVSQIDGSSCAALR